MARDICLVNTSTYRARYLLVSCVPRRTMDVSQIAFFMVDRVAEDSLFSMAIIFHRPATASMGWGAGAGTKEVLDPASGNLVQLWATLRHR